jgi:DNA invertase Pin-like site-specific DNA recombinase
LYARVSTSDQDVQMQVDELRVEAQRRGWKIVGTYTDEGVSGSQERRPQMDRLLAEVAAEREVSTNGSRRCLCL